MVDSALFIHRSLPDHKNNNSTLEDLCMVLASAKQKSSLMNSTVAELPRVQQIERYNRSNGYSSIKNEIPIKREYCDSVDCSYDCKSPWCDYIEYECDKGVECVETVDSIMDCCRNNACDKNGDDECGFQNCLECKEAQKDHERSSSVAPINDNYHEQTKYNTISSVTIEEPDIYEKPRKRIKLETGDDHTGLHTTPEQLLYCHWDDQNWTNKACDVVAFGSQQELSEHLLQNHFDLDSDLVCHWDNCDQSVEDILSHVKNDHIDCCSHHPHEACKDEKVNPNYHQKFHQLQQQESISCLWNACEFQTNEADELAPHLHNHYDRETNNSNFLHNQAKENGINPFQCEWKFCDFESHDYQDFVLHVKDHAQSLVRFQLPSPPSIPQLTPSSESSTPQTPILSGNSINSAASTPPFSEVPTCRWLCEGIPCNKNFASPHELSEHVVEDHIGSRKNEYTCLWEGCERNHRPFKQRQKIIRHLQTHSKNKPFQCVICGTTFAEQAILKQHMRVHSGERPYECKVCGKRFAASTALSVHLRTHTGEKPLICKYPECGKRFSESSNLAKHMKTHYKKESSK